MVIRCQQVFGLGLDGLSTFPDNVCRIMCAHNVASSGLLLCPAPLPLRVSPGIAPGSLAHRRAWLVNCTLTLCVAADLMAAEPTHCPGGVLTCEQWSLTRMRRGVVHLLAHSSVPVQG